jgi:RNA-binding protein 5/10
VPAPAPKAVELSAKAVTSSVTVDNEFEFSDVNALTCLLCARQFKTVEQLKRHNKESELHKVRILCTYTGMSD